jgi:pilus assembly protein CpaB
MKWPVIGLLLTGIGAALAAALLVATVGLSPKTRAAPTQEVSILVAEQDMTALNIVTQESLTRRKLPATEVPTGAMKDPAQAIGRVLARDLRAGQVLTERSFAAEGTGVDVAGRLQPGKRAVTVSLSGYAGLEPLLYPGSVVDVLASFRTTGSEGMAVATTLLQNVVVLAVEHHALGAEEPEDETQSRGPTVSAKPAPTPRRARQVTLMVDPEQAEALQLASEYGSVSLALRNPLDKSQVSGDPTLLSAGRLAKYAEFLQASINPASEMTRSTEDDSLAAVAIPARAPQAAAEWEVQVLRGVNVQTQRFPMPDEAK